jgi:hypothetical protein
MQLQCLPQHPDALRLYQSTRLLRALLLSDAQTLDYYVGIAVKCISDDADETHLDFFSFFEAQNGDPCVNRKRFVIFAALNQSNAFFEWIAKHSADDPVDVGGFCVILASEFRRLIEQLDSTNQPSKAPADVLYPTLDHFVDAMVCRFFQC